jgi:hypothetical protein
MTDKELLELAYKAFMNGAILTHDKDMSKRWNPLTNDGDALRLAVKLNFDVVFDFDRVMAVYGNGYSKEEYFYELPEPTDRYAATRRAIVRAASEIGKGMK